MFGWPMGLIRHTHLQVNVGKLISFSTRECDYNTTKETQITQPFPFFSGCTCFDKDSRCHHWPSYCSWHSYVRANCKKTCNLCWQDSSRVRY